MSYILDALKRAEAETSPDVRAALAIEQDGRLRQRRLGYFVLAALLINAVVLTWLFFPRDEQHAANPASGTAMVSVSDRPPAEPDETRSQTRGSEPPAEPALSNPATTANPAARAAATTPVAGINPPATTPASRMPPATIPAARKAPSRPISTPATADGLVIGPDYQARAAAERPSESAPATVTLAELPASVAARLPEFEYSTHIFATSPDLRAVVINGRRLVEGDQISGVTLNEITEEGVVLGFDGYLISVPVLIDWDE